MLFWHCGCFFILTMIMVFKTIQDLRNCIKPAILSFRRKRLCRNRRKQLQNRHTGESRYPEVTEITGFRVALRLHGMTKK